MTTSPTSAVSDIIGNFGFVIDTLSCDFTTYTRLVWRDAENPDRWFWTDTAEAASSIRTQGLLEIHNA